MSTPAVTVTPDDLTESGNLQSLCWSAFVGGVEAAIGETTPFMRERWLREFQQWWDRFPVEVATTQIADELRRG